MTIRFQDTLSWEQAQLLMQPTLIRVIDNLRKCLEKTDWQGKYEEIQDPIPGYQLHLSQGETAIATLNLWEVCFQICFLNYPPEPPQENPQVDVDVSLFDETGDIAWQRLDEKAKQLIEGVFQDLVMGDGEDRGDGEDGE
ncbi:hypothetical protein PN462_07120 [Spirulina sp. CS-785/01]|uniref:hypothetical protein n=1 Tax=Spirulina sp. CS-785/01 TaxID=3021716 RepID=UPI00232BD70B|nr:hypothetical protein [Spirulina sp. CS-785/01]MDB9312866.1 hypothetical protein [Spirulina sp. CS-785/01]